MVPQQIIFFSTLISFLDDRILRFAGSGGIMTAGARIKAHPQTDEKGLKDRIIAGNATTDDILNSITLVDHSMFIEYFLRSRHPHLIVTAPRKFGKTFNLNLLRKFLEIDVFGEGQTIPKELTKNYRFLSGKGLKIFDHDDGRFVQSNFASHPIIHLEFKKLTLVDSFERFILNFALIIKSLFLEHNYVLRNKSEKDELFKLFMKCSRLSFNLRDSKSIELLMMSGRHLSKLVAEHFKRQCIVLVDDYDLPLSTALFNPHLVLNRKKVDKQDIQLIVDIIGVFLSNLLEENPSVGRSLMTGTTMIGQMYARKLHELHHVRVFDDPEIAKFYGFTQSEVDSLAEKFDRQDDLYKIEYWYKGYTVNAKGSEPLYCPFSVITYLMNAVDDQYWAEVYFGQLDPIFDYNKMGTILEELLEKPREIKLTFVTKDYHTAFLKFINGQQNSNFYDSRGFGYMLQFLAEHGVYSAIAKINDKNTASLQIPNRKVRNIVEKRIYTNRYLKSRYRVNSEDSNKFVGTLQNLSKGTFGEVEVPRVVTKEPDFHDLWLTLTDLWNETRFVNNSDSIFNIYNKTKPSSERMMHTLLHYPITVHGGFHERQFEYVRVDIPTKLSSTNRGLINFLMITKKMTAAIVMVMKYGEGATSRTAINDIIRYSFTEYNWKYRLYDIGFYGSDIHYFSCPTKIYIGAHLSTGGNLTISYLYNTLDMDNAIEFSYHISK